MRRPVMPFSTTGSKLVVLALLLAMAGGFFLLFVLPGMIWTQKRQKYWAASTVHALGRLASDYHDEHGRYPADRAEYESIGGADRLRLLERAMEKSRVTPTGFTAFPEPARHAPIARWTFDRGFIELYPDSRVAVSPNLAPAPDLRPEWLLVVEQPGDATEGRGG